jgi:hypothetical protein
MLTIYVSCRALLLLWSYHPIQIQCHSFGASRGSRHRLFLIFNIKFIHWRGFINVTLTDERTSFLKGHHLITHIRDPNISFYTFIFSVRKAAFYNHSLGRTESVLDLCDLNLVEACFPKLHKMLADLFHDCPCIISLLMPEDTSFK